MRRTVLVAWMAAVLCGLCAAQSAVAAKATDRLDAYNAVVGAGELQALTEQGYDIAGQRQTKRGTRVDLVLSKAQRAQLARKGIKTNITRVKGGRTVRQFAMAQAAGGFNVWRSYDEPGGIRDQMYAIARKNRGIAKLEKIGTTLQGREILALKITKNARKTRDGRKPAVLYSATQHAREWIAAETNRRLLNYYVNGYRAGKRGIRKQLAKTELWFILVANPDGYQYTFDHERLWRKNLRDNNGDGETADRRRRRPQPQLPESLGLRRGGLLVGRSRATPTAAPPRTRRPRPRR